MGTKTIGIGEEVYERLKSRKRDDESFTDLVDRLLDETTVNWREGFGTLDPEQADELEKITERSRQSLSRGLAGRQTESIDQLASGREDETP